MNILISGYRGFIGSRLWVKLELSKHNIVGYDLQDGDNTCDYFKLDKIFRENNFDIVIHLAARTGVRTSKKFPEEYVNTNINGTGNVIKCCEEHEIKHLIFFSSSSVHGNQLPPNKETDRLEPSSLYGITKLAGELLIKNSNIPLRTVIRPFTVYGENGRKDQVIIKWINQIKSGKPLSFFGQGQTKRGYTYVGDLVDGIINLIEEKDKENREPFEIYNLGGSEITSLEDLYNIFNRDIIIERNILNLPKGDVAENCADITKAKEMLGFNPNTNFKDKVSEIIKKELI